MDKTFKIVIRKSAEKQLLSLPKKEGGEIIERIKMLAINPYPNYARKMTGFDNIYRLKHGNYRVIYQIYNKEVIIEVIKIGHRQNIYK